MWNYTPPHAHMPMIRNTVTVLYFNYVTLLQFLYSNLIIVMIPQVSELKTQYFSHNIIAFTSRTGFCFRFTPSSAEAECILRF